MTDRPLAIDVQSMLVLMVASAMLMASILWFAFAGRFREGLGRWTTSLWAQALAWLLLALRGLVPEVLSIAGGNGLLALAWSLQLAALGEFRRRPVRRGLFWVPAAAVFAVSLALVGYPDVNTAVFSVLYGMGNLGIAVSVLRERPAGVERAHLLLAACYATAAATLIVLPWAQPEGLHAMPSANSYYGLLYLGVYALIVAGSVAFLLMHKERSDEESSRLATTDPLTGVFNRRTFIELAEQELARSHRAGTPLALMIFDLDHFKRVNDSYGHLTGDEVLVAFTRLVRDCLRRGDLLVRYGGEEFCVLLPATNLPAAAALAERIRARWAAGQPTEKPFKVTVSVGVAAHGERGTTTLGDLLARADEALYRAKEDGRNRIVALPLAAAPPEAQRVLPLENAG